MLSLLPNEILHEIFSYLTIQQLFKMGTVCRSWQLQRDLAVFKVIRMQANLHICTSPKLNQKNMMDLMLSSYDESTGLLEFKPMSDDLSFDADIQGLRMVYGGWPHDVQPTYQRSLTPVERAQYAFHHQYNPIHQTLYLLPPHDDPGMRQNRFWSGDLSVGAMILLEKDIQTETVRVVLARVSIPWILSGYTGRGPTFTKADTVKNRLKLNMLGPDARYVISNATTGAIIQDDGDHITQQPQTTAIGRWQRLNQELTLRQINPQVIWKYHIVQLFILGRSALPLDDVITKIYIGENEWEKMKPGLAKALLHKQEASPMRESLRSRLRSLFSSS